MTGLNAAPHQRCTACGKLKCQGEEQPSFPKSVLVVFFFKYADLKKKLHRGCCMFELFPSACYSGTVLGELCHMFAIEQNITVGDHWSLKYGIQKYGFSSIKKQILKL